MVDKLRAAEATYRELQMKMADPEVAANSNEFQKVAKAAADLEETVNAFRLYRDTEQQLVDAQKYLKEEAANDPEMAEFAKEEIAELEASLKTLHDKAGALQPGGIAPGPLDGNAATHANSGWPRG